MEESVFEIKGKMPSRTEIVQLADTWPVKEFEPLVRCLCIHASLTFVKHVFLLRQ